MSTIRYLPGMPPRLAARLGVGAVESPAEPPAEPATPPSLLRQAGTLATSTARWIAAGRPVRSGAALAAVMRVCAGDLAAGSPPCAHWEPTAYAGLGRCRVCGCSGVKQAWATEACPHGKWAAEALQAPAE